MNILTPTGYKPIADIAVGDEVTAWNFVDSVQETNVVEAIDPITPDYVGFTGDDVNAPREFCWYTINGTWTLFTDQTVMVNDPVGNHAFELNVGDTIYDASGNPSTITTIDKVTSTDTWLRLQVSGDHGYIVDDLAVHNASRFWVTGGVNDNWGTIGNWSTTSGGAGGSAVPLATDAVTMDANSTHNCILDTSSRVCASIVQTNWGTRTFTFNQILSVSGSVTIPSTITTTGAQRLNVNAVGTLNIVPTLAVDFSWGGTTYTSTLARALTINSANGLQFNSTGTITMSGAFTMTAGSVLYGAGSYLLSGAIVENSTGTTFNTTTNVQLAANSSATSVTIAAGGGTLSGSFNYTVSGGLTATGAMNVSTGGPIMVLTGGTWSGAGIFGINLTLNGNVTVSGSVAFTFGTFLYTSGTITTTSSTIAFSSCALNCSAVTWNNVSFQSTISLQADINVGGTFTSVGGTQTVTGSFNINTVSATLSGAINSTTANLIFSGGGTWSGTSNIGMPSITLNGTTVSGTVSFSTGTLSPGTGTNTFTGSTITVIAPTPTMDMGGTANRINNLTIGSGASFTLTLNSDLYVDGTITISNIVTFSGTGVWVANNFTHPLNTTVTLKSGLEYKITGAYTGTGTSASHAKLVCSVASGTKALLTLSGTQSLIYYDATDIDSSKGYTIFSAGGTLTRTVNWSTVIGNTPPIGKVVGVRAPGAM